MPGGPAASTRETVTRWGVLALAVAIFVVAWGATAWVCDDGYIVFRVVRNLVDGHGPAWNPGQRVQVFTDPLWVLLLWPLAATGLPPHQAALGASVVLSSLGVLGLLAPAVRTSWRLVLLGLLLLLGSRSFMHFTSSGLETPLLLVLLVALRATLSQPGGLGGGTLVAALLVLCRPDALVVALPLLAPRLLARVRSVGGPRAGAELAAGALPLLAWCAFAIAWYGTPVPNTFFAKVTTGSPLDVRVSLGVGYVLDSVRHDPLLAPVLVGALVAPAVVRAPGTRSTAAAISLHLLYVVLTSGDYMPGRFLFVPYVLGVASLLEVLAAGLSETGVRRAWIATALACATLAVVWPRIPLAMERWRGVVAPLELGVHDWQRDARWPHRTWNWAPDPGIRPPLRAVEGRRRVELREAAGGTVYVLPPDTHVVDVFAITDPLLARLPAPGGGRGHFERTVPEGYLEVLAGTEDALADPALDAFRVEVARVTEGPLWTRARWASIARLSLAPLAPSP
ncbi:MAG: hypothetical protein H6732_12765 [Alphaproteobacteria bacterium]|nr:hypothetical protein [Alphaproteobacteria bacterium]